MFDLSGSRAVFLCVGSAEYNYDVVLEVLGLEAAYIKLAGQIRRFCHHR